MRWSLGHPEDKRTPRPCDQCCCQLSSGPVNQLHLTHLRSHYLSSACMRVCVCVRVFKVNKKRLSISSQVLLGRLSLHFHALFCHLKRLAGSVKSAGCWHLAVAPPVDRMTLRYWPVCWKARVSLYFEQSTSMCYLYDASISHETLGERLLYVLNVLGLLHFCLLLYNYSLFFAPSVLLHPSGHLLWHWPN